MLQNPLAGILPPDQADLVLIMVLSIPLSYLLSYVYNKWLMLAITMSLTMSIQSYLFHDQKWLLWGQQQLVYLMLLLLPRRLVGHVILFQSFGALMGFQLWRLYDAYGENKFDITGIFMMQMFNWIGMGYNYQNGARDPEALSKDQLQRRLVDFPNYITYLGYVNFTPACLVGPSYEYVHYEKYLMRKGDYESIPNTFVPFVKEIGVFALSIGMYFFLGMFPLEYMLDPEFQDYNVLFRLFYAISTITYIELKYISVWSLGMVSMRASGITYNPQKNKVAPDGTVQAYDFTKIEVNNMTEFYLNPSFKVKVDHWNISIALGLRRYIYENVCDPKGNYTEKEKRSKQGIAQIVVIAFSAIWHGLYVGYYVSFFHWVLYIQCCHEVFRIRRTDGSWAQRWSKNYKAVWDLAQNVVSTIAMTYFGLSFHFMVWDKVWTAARVTWFIPYFILYISHLIVVDLKLLTPRKPKKLKGQKEEEKTPLTEIKKQQ